MLEVLKKRLGSWGNKYVSLGGRIVLINAVLSAIPIFFLSFMKMPVCVWREVVKIQRNFLWGGVSLKRRISWVKWSDICKPKKEGGLGIRDLRLVNVSLLAKWRWNLLTEGEEVWKNVIVARYGHHAIGNLYLEATLGASQCSLWWKDLCRVDSGVGWFNQVVAKKLGSGNATCFWKDIWVGDQSLEQRFPRLFNISTQQDMLIRNMGSWVNGVWRWELLWRRNFFVWEEVLFLELGEVINSVELSEVDDSWTWKPQPDVGFTVKTLYEHLDRVLLPQQHNLSPFAQVAFKNIWRTAVPSKVSALAWQVFLDRIPTRDNLRKRGIIPMGENLCPLCGTVGETSNHLFLHCSFAAAVWYALNRWLGVVVVLPGEVILSYGQLVGSGRNKRIRKGFSSVWLAFVWTIWKTRNDKIFNNVNGDVEVAVEYIQRISWQWFLNKVAANSCLLYEWIWDPGECMLL
jgi:hypothetical protein